MSPTAFRASNPDQQLHRHSVPACLRLVLALTHPTPTPPSIRRPLGREMNDKILAGEIRFVGGMNICIRPTSAVGKSRQEGLVLQR